MKIKPKKKEMTKRKRKEKEEKRGKKEKKIKKILTCETTMKKGQGYIEKEKRYQNRREKEEKEILKQEKKGIPWRIENEIPRRMEKGKKRCKNRLVKAN